MSDLISRKALLEDMKHFCRGNCRNCDWSTFLANDEHCGLIDRQPTAYDIDKVVERLEEASELDDSPMYEPIEMVELEKAIEIVKSGGKV